MPNPGEIVPCGVTLGAQVHIEVKYFLYLCDLALATPLPKSSHPESPFIGLGESSDPTDSDGTGPFDAAMCVFTGEVNMAAPDS